MHHRVPIKNKKELTTYLFNASQSYYVGLLTTDELITEYKNRIEDVTFASRPMKLDFMSSLLTDLNNFITSSNIEFKKLIDILQPIVIKQDFKQIKKILFFYRLNEYRKIQKNKDLNNMARIDLRNKVSYIIRIMYQQPLIFENTIFPLISKDWSKEKINDFKLDNRSFFIEFYDDNLEFDNKFVEGFRKKIQS